MALFGRDRSVSPPGRRSSSSHSHRSESWQARRSSSSHGHRTHSPAHHGLHHGLHHNHHDHHHDRHRSSSPGPPPYNPPAPQRKSFLSRLAIPLAIFVGCAITAGTTYALVARVQHLIATATVGGSISSWIQQARIQVYDGCYLGCNDCSDPFYAWNNCQITTQVSVKNTICDASKMWNWATADRYPDACLEVVGRMLMGNALDQVKQGYRNQLAIIILTVLGGLVGGLVTYYGWRRVTWKRAQKAREEKSEGQNGGGKGKGKGWVRKIPLLGLLVGGKGVAAYACTGRDAVWNQYFIDNSTGVEIVGVVHGWLSHCYDSQNCIQSCSQSCTTKTGGSKGCSQHCTNNCYTVTNTDRTPKQYVDAILPKIQACGFALRDSVDDIGTIASRIGNAAIERDYWVRISVNGFNVTKATDTDEAVMCLHDIGGK
ncbi:hypothetical protein QBC46DRAFT_324007 [Diplogelasinospora grovesii]|uniref:Uncharacterized protein n=1 Tax=Diplogelasinospora grovesii TaxID=303347 RepID=A0AAN6RZQ4_9PEZI|nr:hypothetical protein QBC46DRAFT_324007 [Diplogelasinospora grovesii]